MSADRLLEALRAKFDLLALDLVRLYGRRHARRILLRAGVMLIDHATALKGPPSGSSPASSTGFQA